MRRKRLGFDHAFQPLDEIHSNLELHRAVIALNPGRSTVNDFSAVMHMHMSIGAAKQ